MTHRPQPPLRRMIDSRNVRVRIFDEDDAGPSVSELAARLGLTVWTPVSDGLASEHLLHPRDVKAPGPVSGRDPASLQTETPQRRQSGRVAGLIRRLRSVFFERGGTE